MSGKRRRKIVLRLPEEHWLWEIEDAKRNNEIRFALELYHRMGRKLDRLISVIEENEGRIGMGALPAQEKSQDREEENANQAGAPEDRLLANMDKFLEF